MQNNLSHDLQHNDTQQNEIRHNNTQNNQIKYNDVQYDDIQHNYTPHNNKNMASSTTILSILIKLGHFVLTILNAIVLQHSIMNVSLLNIIYAE